jgi:hypothetical protein
MSGGHWEYSHLRLREILEEIADDKTVKQEFPKIAKTFKELSSVLYEIVHDLDWHISSDTIIERPDIFDRQAINKIGEHLC